MARYGTMLSEVSVSSTNRKTTNVRGLARARSAASSPSRSCVSGSSTDFCLAGSACTTAGCGVNAAALSAPPDDARDDTLRKFLVPSGFLASRCYHDTGAATLWTIQFGRHVEVICRTSEGSDIRL